MCLSGHQWPKPHTGCDQLATITLPMRIHEEISVGEILKRIMKRRLASQPQRRDHGIVLAGRLRGPHIQYTRSRVQQPRTRQRGCVHRPRRRVRNHSRAQTMALLLGTILSLLRKSTSQPGQKQSLSDAGLSGFGPK